MRQQGGAGGPDAAADGRLFDLYEDWRLLERRLSGAGRRAEADAAGLDAISDAQTRLVERIAEIPAWSLRALLAKMTVWSRAAAEVSPDCDHREPSDALAYSVFEDLLRLSAEEGNEKDGGPGAPVRGAAGREPRPPAA